MPSPNHASLQQGEAYGHWGRSAALHHLLVGRQGDLERPLDGAGFDASYAALAVGGDEQCDPAMLISATILCRCDRDSERQHTSQDTSHSRCTGTGGWRALALDRHPRARLPRVLVGPETGRLGSCSIMPPSISASALAAAARAAGNRHIRERTC